jgi:hypothetical protein
MKKNVPTKERVDSVNNLCVKTYMEILGYRCLISACGYAIFPSPFTIIGRLYVSYRTNRFRLSHGTQSGGVLDLACALFGQSPANILNNIAQYRLDMLMDKCGSRTGPIW